MKEWLEFEDMVASSMSSIGNSGALEKISDNEVKVGKSGNMVMP